MVSSISSTTNKDEKGVYSWEKTVADVNNIDENFSNARDLGYTRLNYARISTVGRLDKYDSKDIYSLQVQSNGKLSISLRNTTSGDDKVLDLSKYQAALDAIKQQLDPEGWREEQDRLNEEFKNKNLIDTTAEGMNIKVYMVKNGKQVLIADAMAEKGTPERETADAILQGEYKAQKGNYFIEVGKQEGYEFDEEPAYAMQILQGTTYKHDYVMTETLSDDSKNKKNATVASNTSSSYLSAGNAMLIQAQKYQTTAQMLSVGYLNLANITAEKNSTSQLFSTLL